LFENVEEIRKKIDEYDGLIDEEAARMLIFGANLPKIAEAEGNTGLYAKVLSVGKIRKVGKSRVKNAVIGDESGCCLLALWDEKAKVEIKEGNVIKIIDGWVRYGYYGKEINVGKRGTIRKVDKDVSTGDCSNFFNFSGILMKKYPTQVYFNGDAEMFSAKIVVDDKEIILLDERIKDVIGLPIGTKVGIKWAYSEKGKLYLNDFGRIVV